MKITVDVELYTGAHREVVSIDITEDDIHSMAEIKAEQENYCNSCAAIKVAYQLDTT